MYRNQVKKCNHKLMAPWWKNWHLDCQYVDTVWTILCHYVMICLRTHTPNTLRLFNSFIVFVCRSSHRAVYNLCCQSVVCSLYYTSLTQTTTAHKYTSQVTIHTRIMMANILLLLFSFWTFALTRWQWWTVITMLFIVIYNIV